MQSWLTFTGATMEFAVSNEPPHKSGAKVRHIPGAMVVRSHSINGYSKLSSGGTGTRIVQNGCCATHIAYSKDDQRGTGACLNAAIRIIDVDICFAKLGSHARQLARLVLKPGLCNLHFCVGYSFFVQHRLRRFRLVNDDTHEKRFLPRNRLKSHDVYALVRQFTADFSKRSGTILHANGQFLSNGHVSGPPFFAMAKRVTRSARSNGTEVRRG